jgi:hypothetical protein
VSRRPSGKTEEAPIHSSPTAATPPVVVWARPALARDLREMPCR